MEKIEKEVLVIKNVQNFSDLSYVNSGDASKSNISTFKLNQSTEKSNSK